MIVAEKNERETKIRELLEGKGLSWDGPIPIALAGEISAIADPYTIRAGRNHRSFNPAIAAFAEMVGDSYGKDGTSSDLSRKAKMGECFYIHGWKT